MLHGMAQQALDGIGMLREDIADMDRCVGRLERGVLALQRAHVDRLEGDMRMQAQIDALIRRMERVEEWVG
jgi:hypothetical protein